MIVPATLYSLKCDLCELSLGESRLTSARVKEAARQRGWVRLLQQDLCPRCQIAAPKEKAGCPLEGGRIDPLAGSHRCLGRPADVLDVPDRSWPSLLSGERGGAAAPGAGAFSRSNAASRLSTHHGQGRLVWAQTIAFRWKEKACPIAFMTRLRSKLGQPTGASD